MATRNENATPWIAIHPGTILKYEIEERGMSQKNLADKIGMRPSHLNEIIKGKRAITIAVADKIEDVLGIPSVSLVNMQNQYEHDKNVLERRSVEEQEAVNTLTLYNEIFDVKTFFSRSGRELASAAEKVAYLTETAHLPQPAEFQYTSAGMFRKSSKTGQNPRMLMTWKILAETKARSIKPVGTFKASCQDKLVSDLSHALHDNTDTEARITRILSDNGIVFCTVEKVDKASVDGYSFIEDGIPYVILTKRYKRIDNFAFALMHEIGHIFLHYLDCDREECRLSIPDYDSESREEKEANAFAADALIPDTLWSKAPKVRMNPFAIQKEYTQWAKAMNMNKWIVLGRIAHETGMYRFKSDETRNIH